MTTVSDEESPQLRRILQAIDALDAHGFSCWLVEEVDEETDLKQTRLWSVEFQEFPDQLPVLESEITLLASVIEEIMVLGSYSE